MSEEITYKHKYDVIVKVQDKEIKNCVVFRGIVAKSETQLKVFVQQWCENHKLDYVEVTDVRVTEVVDITDRFSK